jgi:hypothetical protein
MAISDQLSRLSARTKGLEDRAAAARQKAHDDLERDVEAARQEAKRNAEALRESAEAGAAEVSAWWIEMSRSWDEHLAKVRGHVDQKIAQHDLNAAKLDVEDANAYAAYLIDYCYAAVQEAEYAVLDAELAQMEYDDLSAKQTI